MQDTSRRPRDGKPEPAPRLIATTRHLLDPGHVRDSFVLTRQPSPRNAALAGTQAAIAAAIALPLTWLSPWSHMIGFVSLGVLVALFGRFAPPRRRNAILLRCAAWQTLAVLVMSAAVWLGAPTTLQLAMLALACGLFFFISVTGNFGAPGPLIFIFAAGASMADALSLHQVVERTLATAAAAALSLAICTATEALRHHAPEGVVPAEPARPVSHRLVAAIRIVAGATLAVYASYRLGANHPAWAAMGTLAVMQGAHLHITLHRALQRMAGTVVGSLLAWLLLVQEPSIWVVIAAVVVLQFLTEIIIGTNYALGQTLVTPMALLMTHLAAPDAAGAAMASERVLDTVLGASIGICAAVLLSSYDDRRHLAERQAARRSGRRRR